MGDLQTTLQELKARAYDILVNLQNLQSELAKVNQEIQAAGEKKTEITEGICSN